MNLNDYKLIDLSNFDNLSKINYLSSDVDNLLYLDGPSISVLRDYKYHSALTVPENRPVQDVKTKILDNHKDFILVTNSNNEVIGTISLHFLEGVALHKQSKNIGVSITDMTADDVMLKLSKTKEIAFDILSDAKIGHILKALIDTNSHHILVSDLDKNGNKYIRGYFSYSFIRRKLGLDITHTYNKDSISSISSNRN